jgi:hypothetical protein
MWPFRKKANGNYGPTIKELEKVKAESRVVVAEANAAIDEAIKTTIENRGTAREVQQAVQSGLRVMQRAARQKSAS